MLVKEVMTKTVVTVPETMGIRQLAKLLIEKNISGAPVLDAQRKVVGVVREESVIFRDKKVHLPSFIHIATGFLTVGVKHFEDEIKKITAGTVGEIMEKKFCSVPPDATVEDVATLMIEQGVFYCLVMDNNELCGIITKRDIVRSIAREQ